MDESDPKDGNSRSNDMEVIRKIALQSTDDEDDDNEDYDDKNGFAALPVNHFFSAYFRFYFSLYLIFLRTFTGGLSNKARVS